MMSKKIFSRASLVCGASFVVLAYALVGCGKQEAESVAPTEQTEPSNAHMKDARLKQKLREQIHDREALDRVRQILIGKMEALVSEKYHGDMKAAANDPEMISLIRRAHDLEANVSSNRAHAAEMIRARANANRVQNVQKGAAPAGAAPKDPLKKEVK